MDNNIYSIDAWQPFTTYFKNKILSNNGLYYYVAFDNYTSASTITSDINNGYLNGYIYHMGQNKPYFTWRPNFNFSNENQPRVKKIQFGDGYFQVVPDGVNNLLLNYEFEFQAIEIHEATAILHFLTTRNGTESFCFLPPAPRGQISRFLCSKWTDIQTFWNNYTIKATFTQTPV